MNWSQVPQRVTDQVRQLMPGTVTWKEKCEDVPYDRTEVYFVPVTKTVKRYQPEPLS